MIAGLVLRLAVGTAATLAVVVGTSSSTLADSGAVQKSGQQKTTSPFAVEQQADGSILIAGIRKGCAVDQACGGKLFVGRFDRRGRLDRTFAEGDGVAVVPQPSDMSIFVGLKLSEDGAILVSGLGSDSKTVVARLNTDGRVDESFGQDGEVSLGGTTFLGGGPNALTTSAGGEILLAGSQPDGGGFKSAVARLDQDGALDPAFGQGGIASLRIDPAADREGANAVATEANGAIVIAGGSGPTTLGNQLEGAFTVARLLPNGVPDPTFGDNGRSTIASQVTAYSNLAAATSIGLLPSGKALLAGSRTGGLKPCPNFTVARLTPGGDPDPGFGVGGVTTTPTPDCEAASDSVLAVDGSVFVTGIDGPFVTKVRRLALAQFDSAGVAHGNAGLIANAQVAGLPSGGNAITIDGSGRILAAGPVDAPHCWTGRKISHFAVCQAAFIARLGTNGSLDRSFGTAGIATLPTIRVCPKSPLAPCPGYPDRHGFRHLVRRSLPTSAHLRAHRLRVRLGCKKRIRESCRITLSVRRHGQTARVRAKVGAGASRLVTLNLGAGPADRVQSARHAQLHERVATAHQRAVSVRTNLLVH